MAYTTAIIYCTVYPEVHWLLDLPPGILLGWAAVRLSDWLLVRLWPGQAPTARGQAAVATASVR